MTITIPVSVIVAAVFLAPAWVMLAIVLALRMCGRRVDDISMSLISVAAMVAAASAWTGLAVWRVMR